MPRLDQRLIFAGVMSLMMSACTPWYGPTLSEHAPATRPAGIASVLDLGNDTLRAEMLALEEDALIVLVDRSPDHRLAGRLVRVPLTGIRTARFADASEIDYSFWTFFLSLIPPGPHKQQPLVTHGIDPDPAVRARLRMLARYPQGVTDDLLARLETVYGEMASVEQADVRDEDRR